MHDFQLLIGFLILGVLFAAGAAWVPALITPRYEGAKTHETYECGIDTIGSAWIRFSIAYYLFALIFVAFEVDVLYLFPVAMVYGEFLWRDLVEITIFIGILSLAIVYAWRKGVFTWE